MATSKSFVRTRIRGESEARFLPYWERRSGKWYRAARRRRTRNAIPGGVRPERAQYYIHDALSNEADSGSTCWQGGKGVFGQDER